MNNTNIGDNRKNEIKLEGLEPLIVVKDLVINSTLVINSIGAFIKLDFQNKNDSNKKIHERLKEDTEKIKNKLREWLLDMRDFLYGIELELPLMAIFENLDDETYELMHKIAGDQDWHRGDFAIVVSREDIYNKLTTETISFDPKMEWKEITFKEIADLIKQALSNIQDEDKDCADEYKNMLTKIANALENEQIEEGFKEWENDIKQKLSNLEIEDEKD